MFWKDPFLRHGVDMAIFKDMGHMSLKGQRIIKDEYEIDEGQEMATRCIEHVINDGTS